VASELKGDSTPESFPPMVDCSLYDNSLMGNDSLADLSNVSQIIVLLTL
jgi:hypothetical protein